EVSPDPMSCGNGVIIPLRARARLVGALTLSSCSRRYDEGVVRVCADLAPSIALAVDNALGAEQLAATARRQEDILAMVIHDLRNPLHTIMVSVEAHVQADDPDTLRTSLRTCQRAARHMAHLVSNLVDAVSLDGGALSLVLSEQSPGHLLTDTVAL